MRRRKPKRKDSRTLLAYLQNISEHNADVARQALKEMAPEEAVGMLLTWLEADRLYRRGLPVQVVVRIAAILAVFWVLGLFGLRLGYDGWPTLFVFVAFGIWQSSLMRSRSVDLLVNYDDVRVINPLVTAMSNGSPDRLRSAQLALTSLLPKLTPAEVLLLSPDSRDYLNQSLLLSPRPAFVLAILAAWEQIGDGGAVPYVERLANGEGATGGDAKVRDAAAGCVASDK